MSGGTHVFDMIKRIKENENLKKNNYFKKVRQKYVNVSAIINLDDRKATEEERNEIRIKVNAHQRRIVIKSIIILAVSITLTAALVYFILNFVKPGPRQWHL
jgi:hypothetical protein